RRSSPFFAVLRRSSPFFAVLRRSSPFFAVLRRSSPFFAVLSLILSAAHYTYAYSPPFSYASGICDYFVTSGTWYTRMVADLGEQKFFEKWYPGTLVDSAGDLYAVRMDTGGWGGPSWYINRLSANSQNGISGDWNSFGVGKCDGRYGATTRLSLSNSSEEALFKSYGWHILQPCIAQEVNGTTDYLYAFVFAPPARWTGSSNDCEGIGWVKLQKSKISRSGGHIVGAKLFNYGSVLHINTFTPLNPNYNQNLFSAIHDVGAGKTSVYWLSTQGASGLRLNYLTLDNAGNDLVSTSSHDTRCANSDEYNLNWTYTIEPRILKGNDKYYLSVVNDICAYLYEANASTGNTTSHTNFPFSSWSGIIESAYAQRVYHSDIGMVKTSNGTEVLLMLHMAKGSYLTAVDNRWSTSYVTWSLGNIVLGLASRVGSTWKLPPENCLAVFPVTSATVGDATSASTLYKNTNMFVVCGEYIIYAYCYPGGGKGLVLGVAHYTLDANKHVHLLTKREFVDSSGNSFSHLTECTRIISMDAKNGHLWITFVKGISNYYYFHAFVDDIIKHAAS
ncbi:MAG: hypothetical protein LBD69_02740, partial [Puniceicoccales bacterium]|nr:hypothetical protein [Puniceicoccales bacterium]